jgi:hypothetical protein
MQVAAMPTLSARKSATIKNLLFMVVGSHGMILRRLSRHCLQLMSAFEVKQTSTQLTAMSTFDPKRT